MTPLRHFVFFYGVFRSLYVIKVPFYLGGRFLIVSGFTRDFPISLPRLQAGPAGEREEPGGWARGSLSPVEKESTGLPWLDGLTYTFGSNLIFCLG